MTFSQLRAETIATLYSEGEVENLVGPHSSAMMEAMVDLSRHNDCLQQLHTDRYPLCAVYYRAGTSVIPAPRGRVSQVYTVLGENYGSRVRYAPTDFKAFERWSRRFTEIMQAAPVTPHEPLNVGMEPALPFGYKYSDRSTDSPFGRAVVGHYVIRDGQMIIAPWLQSNEILVVEWKGLKLHWSPEDFACEDDATVYKRAVRMWVEADDAKRPPNADLKAFDLAMALYADAKAQLMWECNERQRVPHNPIVIPEDVEYMEITNPYGALPPAP